MTNSQIAAALAEIGTLLELQGESSFRTNAYHMAARAIDQQAEEVGPKVRAGTLGHIPGVGATLTEKIEVLVATGTCPQLEELRASTPPGLVQMLRVPGLGPKKVNALSEQEIADLDQLRAACQDGRVAKLKGFGAKTQTKILEGLEFLDRAGSRIRIDTADAMATPILAALRKVKGVAQVESCGSLRRRKETIGDLDFLAAAAEPGPIMDAFAALPGVEQVLNRGDTLMSVLLPVGSGPAATSIRADLRVVSEAQFPFGLHHLTGSKEHNIAMRGRAQNRGCKLNEYGLVGPKGDIACASEADLFKALDLTYIPPELREDTGEFKNPIPQLIEISDIRGVFHNHTTASDGNNTLEEMADAAMELGFEYLGIADHSQSLTVARGLSPERVRAQRIEIDALNEQFTGFRLFHGIECDILGDGSLDYDDDVLAEFDYVVASVHSLFAQPREEMTARIVRAVSHPRVTMLGHATGRLILRREGYNVDLDAVLKAAAEAGTMIEINAQPKRLDIDWIHARRARDMGIPIVINPDAHACEELALFRYGVDVARRAWLTKVDVFNTQSLKEVSKRIATHQ